MTDRAGVTLLELILVLAILGLMAGIVGLVAPRTIAVPKSDSAAARAMALRASAIRTGRVVTGDVSVRSDVAVVSAYPDGRIVADSALHIDQLSGRISHAAR